MQSERPSEPMDTLEQGPCKKQTIWSKASYGGNKEQGVFVRMLRALDSFS